MDITVWTGQRTFTAGAAELVDASDLIENDATLSIITAKDENTESFVVTLARTSVRSRYQATLARTRKWRSARLSTTVLL